MDQPTKFEIIARELYDTIQSVTDTITLADEDAKPVYEPEKSRFINFDYVSKSGKNYGNITISISYEKQAGKEPEYLVRFYFGKNIGSEMDRQERIDWYNFVKEIRSVSAELGAGFEARDISKKKLKKKQEVAESKMYGSYKVSYEPHGDVKIIVKHNKNIDPFVRGSRSRNVDSVYVSNAYGERFKLPFKNIMASRAMANHLSNGGRPYDGVYDNICSVVQDLQKLSKFLRKCKSYQFEDPSLIDLYDSVRAEYYDSKRVLKDLGSHRKYKKAVSELYEKCKSYSDDRDVLELKDKFTKRIIDDVVSEALPLVSKIKNKNKQKEKLFDTIKRLLDSQLIQEVKNRMSVAEGSGIIKYESEDHLVQSVMESLYEYLIKESDDTELVEFTKYWGENFSNKKDYCITECNAVAKFVTEVLKCKSKKQADSTKKEKTPLMDELISELEQSVYLDQDQIEKLNELIKSPVEYGVDGLNAIAEISEFFSDDKLDAMLYDNSKNIGGKSDARKSILSWIEENRPQIYHLLDKNVDFSPSPTAGTISQTDTSTGDNSNDSADQELTTDVDTGKDNNQSVTNTQSQPIKPNQQTIRPKKI